MEYSIWLNHKMHSCAHYARSLLCTNTGKTPFKFVSGQFRPWMPPFPINTTDALHLLSIIRPEIPVPDRSPFHENYPERGDSNRP